MKSIRFILPSLQMKSFVLLLLVLFGAHALMANPYKPTSQDLKQAQDKIRQSYSGETLSMKPTKDAHVFQVFQGTKLLGKAYFRILAPHGEDFTYFALLSSNRSILSFGVLMYSCSTGEQVSTPGWGKRLFGKKAQNLTIGKDVDAVSGGTMTVEAILSDLGSL